MIPFLDFLHILNPNQKSRRQVERYFKKHPIFKSIWVDRSSHPTHLETIIEWAILGGYKHIAVWGGDGTLSRAIQSLYERKALDKVVLCFVPVGTGNDFCRRFSLGSWKKWIREYESDTGKIETYDLGLLAFQETNRIFLNNAGFGRSREALDRTKSHPIKDIKEFHTHKLEVEWENGESHQFETVWAYLGIVFNSPFFNKGLYFDKMIHPADKRLTGILVPPQNRFGLFMKFVKSRLGGSLASSSNMRIEGQEINIKSEEPLYPQVDGEVLTKEGTNELKFKVLPNSFKLLVP
ncbi:hypothetical protein BVX98_07890 [bacterium F11]|nr:hypothetical protein BVX98_07890 [bacterium F11]